MHRWFLAVVLGLLLASTVQAESTDSTQFIGYFRTTAGASDGPGMPGFGAPGAAAKYRLGNEPDTVWEAGVDHRFSQAANAPAKSYLQGVFMLSGYAPIGNSSQLDAKNIAQAYVKMSRYLGDYDLWVGRRYYQRKQIEINDYFWLNTAQGAHVGAGLEDLPLGPGRLDFAILSYEDAGVASLVGPTAPAGTLHSRLFEIRYRDVKLSEALSLGTWLGTTQRPKDKVLGYESGEGQGAAVWLDANIGKSSNTLAVIARRGLGLTQGGANGTPIRENSGSGYDIDEARLLEVSNAYSLNADAYALRFVLLTHSESTGKDGLEGDTITWNSAGIRPTYYLGTYTSVSAEFGYDQVKNELTDKNGSVTKGTLALALSKDKSAGARPTIRVFATQANWSSDFKGLVGGSNYADKTSGWSGGVQTEVWW
jgi:maltoporin